MTAFVIKDDTGRKLDATVDIEDRVVVFQSRGGAKSDPTARNTDYSPALLLVLDRLMRHGLVIERVYVDSTRVRQMPLADRTILSRQDLPCTAQEAFTLISRRMTAVGQASDTIPSRGNRSKRIRIDLRRGWKAEIAVLVGAEPCRGFERHELRLPIEALRKVTEDHIWQALETIRDRGVPDAFGPSTDYDLITDLEERLPPKAVFGVAASEALGFSVLPIHFAGGDKTACFTIMKDAGFTILQKNEQSDAQGALLAPEDQEWVEGNQVRASHLRRERHPAVAKRKKAAFRREHGRLFCERCGMDPVAAFGGPDGEACLEVHHNVVHLSDMQPGHRTRLEDLQCLCANCHRYVHRVLRKGLA